MRSWDHPDVVSLKHRFFSTTRRDELLLNLVMEYVPETLYRVLKHYNNANQQMSLIYVKLYMHKLCMTCSLFTRILSQRTFSFLHLIQSGFMIVSRLDWWEIFGFDQNQMRFF